MNIKRYALSVPPTPFEHGPGPLTRQQCISYVFRPLVPLGLFLKGLPNEETHQV